jgi:1-acyl-sn-glycerol-3-phosphate acyltransferase
MLEAKKSGWFEHVFAIYNHNLLKRRFHSLQASGLDFLKNKSPQIPMIIYANHSSWWDGLAVSEILRRCDYENYVMMEEKQLKKLFLFRKLGAFSVVRENPREAVKSINYAANLLQENPNRTILIFPQGEILPNDVRPLEFYNGISRIIEKIGKCSVLPMALRYEFLGNFKPEIYVKITAPENFNDTLQIDKKELSRKLSAKLTETLDVLKTDVISKNIDDYEKII